MRRLTVVLAAAALTHAPAAFAQDRPDLNGTWTNASRTSLERPAGVDRLVVTEEEAQQIADGRAIIGFDRDEIERQTSDVSAGAPEVGGEDFGTRAYNGFWIDPGVTLAKVRGEYRSSYVIDPEDGRIPRRPRPASGDGAPNRYATGIGGNSDPEALPFSERCLIGFGSVGGPGMTSSLYNNTYQFVHTDDHLMILVEMVHDARIIPIFDSEEDARANHRPDAIRPWLGDSVGWYEGDALVVETINVHPIQEPSSKISESGRLIERFERHSDEEIVYSFTVEDDTLYTRPWTAELSFRPSEGPVYEYACHEGNYAMEGILRGARLQEAAASAGEHGE